MIRRMSPLSRRLGLGAAAVALLSGCATFQNTDTIAVVNGEEITSSEFVPMLDSLAADPASGFLPPVDGVADAGQTRDLLSLVIRAKTVEQFFTSHDVDLAAERTTFIAENVPADDPAREWSDDVLNLRVDTYEPFLQSLVTDLPSPTEDELAAMYDESPASTGLVCLRILVAETEQDANAALDEIQGGRPFAEVASDRSIDPSGAAGGAISGTDNACFPLESITTSIDPILLGEIIDGSAGVTSGPVGTADVWFLVRWESWDEVADDVLALHAQGASGGLQLVGAGYTADVDTSLRYGVWNAATRAVEPAG